MLILKDEFGVVHNFALLDAHTHLRIEGLEGLVPSEFIRNYSKMVRDIAQDIKENESAFRFHFPWDIAEKPIDYYKYCQRDALSLIHPGDEMCKTPDRYLGFDFIITFSANLTSDLPRDYRTANSRVREALVEKSPRDDSPHNNFRFIGFGRLDPNHSDALDAFDNIVQLGLRGLKLHPKEENFDISNSRTKDILKRAAHHGMPVIFHTQEGMASRLEETVNEAILDLIDSNKMELIPRLKVILGHAPWNGVSNDELYRILSHPNIFGELSTLKPESYRDFFSNAKSKIKYERIFEFDFFSELNKAEMEESYYRYFGYSNLNYWSSKLLFGSDTPYPPSNGAAPLLKYLFNKNFIGTASDIQNILAGSALRLIPPIARSNPTRARIKTATGLKYHQKHLKLQMEDSKALGMDPLLEVFPTVRISGAVFSFLKNGRTGSWLFQSLFDSTKPLNIVIPNPYDLSNSPVISGRTGIMRNIEATLGEGKI